MACGCLTIALSTQLIDAGVPGANAATHKSRRAQPAIAPRDAEPLTTGTIPSKPPIASTSARNDNETLPPPYHLPTAPRRRMHECGQKWQAMKMSGEAGDQIWRSFATRCLAAATGPFDKRSDH